MPELRHNIATGDWVIFATERAKRPHDYVKTKKDEQVFPEYKESCPFCLGNENKTPGELFRLVDQNKWFVRVVPNLFGALSPNENNHHKVDGIYISMGGYGSHEVIIENTRHNSCIALMNDEEVANIIRVYKARYIRLAQTKGLESIIIFKNHGLGAGTSLEHPHSQLIATPLIPPHIKTRIQVAQDYFDKTGDCVFCKMVEEEQKSGKRMVLENESFSSFLPYAGMTPFLLWICPKRHASSFDDISDKEIVDLASILRKTLKKLYYGLSNPDFNFVIRSCPTKDKGGEYLHWYLNIIPRLTQPAGFELGSGMFINSSLPEESAEFLRNVNCPGG